MKVSVRREEICAVLSHYYKERIEDFIIAPDDIPVVGKAVRAIVLNPLDNSRKISNIKALRMMAVEMGRPITLMEGKFALEHWLEWIHFVDQHNRFPRAGYGSGDDFGKLR